MHLIDIPPYSEDDWRRDREQDAGGEPLTCLNCERSEWFQPCLAEPDRKYRACKICGFWQEADGTPAYRCRMTVHTCTGVIAEGGQCRNGCGAWGPVSWHAGCWRILTPKELGVYKCPNCDVVISPLHVIRWPVQID